MNTVENDKLVARLKKKGVSEKDIDTINSLVGGYNGWSSFEKMLEKFQKQYPIYEFIQNRVSGKLMHDQCHSSAIHYGYAVKMMAKIISESGVSEDELDDSYLYEWGE